MEFGFCFKNDDKIFEGLRLGSTEPNLFHRDASGCWVRMDNNEARVEAERESEKLLQ